MTIPRIATTIYQKLMFLTKFWAGSYRVFFWPETLSKIILKRLFIESTLILVFDKKAFEKMLIGYARVSTQDQKPQLQLDALKGAGCERIFEEKASGAQRDRPQLTLALGYAREGDTLVVWKLDRLARSLRQLVETVEGLSERGVGFRSLTEALDADTAGGRLFFHIFGALAEFERSVIRERVQAGLQSARRNGVQLGRPRVVSEEKLSAARALLKDGLSKRAVALQLGISAPTLYRYLNEGR